MLSATVRRAWASGGPAAVLKLAREHRGPVVESDGDAYLVTFVFADRRLAPRAVGLVCATLPSGFTRMAALGDGVFARTLRLPRRARVKYHFCPDPPAHLDDEARFALAHSPTARRIDYLNPHIDQVHLPGLRLRMVESILALPGAPVAAPARLLPGVPAGRVEELTIPSKVLRRRKRVLLYRPHGYAACPDGEIVLLLESGDEWRRTAVFDNLVATGQVPPFLGVLVGGGGFAARLHDLTSTGAHTRFVVEELLPELWRRVPRPAHGQVAAGFSAAAVAAAALALSAPESFPRLLAISGAWQLGATSDIRRPGQGSSSVLDQFRRAPAVPRRSFLAAGEYEDAWRGRIYSDTAALAGLLAGRAAVRFETGPSGHDTVSARYYLAEGLRWLLTGGPVPARPEPATRP